MHRPGEPTQNSFPFPNQDVEPVASHPHLPRNRTVCRASRSRGSTLPNHGRCGSAGPSSTRSRSTNARIPRTIMVLAEEGLPRGQEPNPATARASRSQLRPAATRVRRVPWRDSARRILLGRLWKARPLGRLGKARPLACLVLGALSPAETLMPRFCDSELVDPAECATRELRGRGSRRPQTRRRRSRRPSRTNATMRGGSPSGALCSRTPSRSCTTRSRGCG